MVTKVGKTSDKVFEVEKTAKIGSGGKNNVLGSYGEKYIRMDTIKMDIKYQYIILKANQVKWLMSK